MFSFLLNKDGYRTKKVTENKFGIFHIFVLLKKKKEYKSRTNNSPISQNNEYLKAQQKYETLINIKSFAFSIKTQTLPSLHPPFTYYIFTKIEEIPKLWCHLNSNPTLQIYSFPILKPSTCYWRKKGPSNSALYLQNYENTWIKTCATSSLGAIKESRVFVESFVFAGTSEKLTCFVRSWRNVKARRDVFVCLSVSRKYLND